MLKLPALCLIRSRCPGNTCGISKALCTSILAMWSSQHPFGAIDRYLRHKEIKQPDQSQLTKNKLTTGLSLKRPSCPLSLNATYFQVMLFLQNISITEVTKKLLFLPGFQRVYPIYPKDVRKSPQCPLIIPRIGVEVG